MTPEKIKQLRQTRLEENSLKRAMKRTKREDRFREEERAEAKRFESQAGYRKAADKLFAKHYKNDILEWEKRVYNRGKEAVQELGSSGCLKLA